MIHALTSTNGSALLDRAAGEALEPLGLVRMPGTSAWLDDHGWWVVVVELEERRAGGTGLVMFADFLWHVRDRPGRTVLARVRQRGRLLDQDGPELVCREDARGSSSATPDALARRAVMEVWSWREAFPTLRHWAAYLAGSAEDGSVWREYDAAVAMALAGDDAAARRWFGRVFDHPVQGELFSEADPDAVAAAQQFAVGLAARLDEPDAFRATLRGRAAAARARLELPPAALR